MINLKDMAVELTTLFETITAAELQAHMDRRGYDIEVVDLEAEAHKIKVEEYFPIFGYPAEGWKAEMVVERDHPPQWAASPEMIWAKGIALYEACKEDVRLPGLTSSTVIPYLNYSMGPKSAQGKAVQHWSNICLQAFFEEHDQETKLTFQPCSPISDAANSSEVALAA